ncbi:Rab family GTPase [Candidatus Lokiarchaeum ossiferum]|uniref:Rab family GTPase n=1 Tax=Candidatus Lokiarchaeum ossiferum TaxID=2951803 RepID=UPI00352E9789
MSVYKIAIVGDGGVGKSSLLSVKDINSFDKRNPITIGVDFKVIDLESLDETGCRSSFLAMDLGGQERFHFLHNAYINGIRSALILYDVSRFRTFFNLRKWYNLIRSENPQIPILIVGNKIDLIGTDEIDQHKKDLDKLLVEIADDNIFGYFFTSAKEATNVQETFLICEEMVLHQYRKQEFPRTHITSAYLDKIKLAAQFKI